jgi:aldose 1-epimerase
MLIEKSVFGVTTKGETAYLFTLTNKNGNMVKVLNYGCIIHSILLKDKNDQVVDVVMGFDTIGDYETAGGFVGALIGRCANRINDGTFVLNNQVYKLNLNEGTNHLHGGYEGFSKKVWKYEILEDSITFTYLSQDGEENYPGNLQVNVNYKWNDSNELVCLYTTYCDQDTVVNLTNHSYFNLNGINKENAFEQKLKINGHYFTPINEKGHLTGEVLSLEHSCFDFLQLKSIKEKYDENEPQIMYANGFDHNFVLGNDEVSAELYSEETGIEMKLKTDSVGLQFYSGNYLRDTVGKYGVKYGRRCAVCLEPQYFPNSINFRHFRQPVHLAKKEYKSQTTYSFKILN